jgi:SpoVK/Ycf46/Vps4 family AAA+-type ATPase
MNSPAPNPLLEQFQKAVADCHRLYRSSAQLCIEQFPGFLPGTPEEFVQLMDDLHKGLLIKIYVSIVEVDDRWTRGEKQLGKVLFDHIWPGEVNASRLREAATHVFREASELKWYSLIRPFRKITPLQEKVGELEAVVSRVANLVARADGKVGPREDRRLRTIMNELQLHLQNVQDDSVDRSAAPTHSQAALAVQEIRQQTEEVRQQCEIQASVDIEVAEKSAEERLAESLERLDALIGLESVKDEIRTLTNFLRLQQQRAAANLPKTELTLHMVFGGNPGTGKTTVARIVGQIYGSMGILEKGHLVETDRSGLVAEYAGQTAPRANQKVDEAMDGVLFIDEAYSLVADSGDDPFGREAVQTLLKRMEDDRRRIVVILAGYPLEMERLLRSNPGLSSRFNTQLTFEDYSPGELGRIFGHLCDHNHYRLPAATQQRLLLGFSWLYENRDAHFGNGRLVRNVFENSIRKLANRIVDIRELDEKALTTILPEDIDFTDVPEQAWENQDE